MEVSMAIGAEAVSSMELRPISGEAPQLGSRRVRQAGCVEVLLAQIDGDRAGTANG